MDPRESQVEAEKAYKRWYSVQDALALPLGFRVSVLETLGFRVFRVFRVLGV